MSQRKMNDELAAFEAALASLSPAESRIDRDRLMYLAGRVSGASAGAKPPRGGPLRASLWPVATAASLLAAVTVVAMFLGRGPRVVEKVVYVRVDVEKPQPEPRRPQSSAVAGQERQPARYLELRRLIVAQGVDALPKVKRGSSSQTKVPKWEAGSPNRIDPWLGG